MQVQRKRVVHYCKCSGNELLQRPALSERCSLFDGSTRASKAKDQVVCPQVIDFDRNPYGVSQET